MSLRERQTTSFCHEWGPFAPFLMGMQGINPFVFLVKQGGVGWSEIGSLGQLAIWSLKR
jgi:hypothetical protein